MVASLWCIFVVHELLCALIICVICCLYIAGKIILDSITEKRTYMQNGNGVPVTEEHTSRDQNEKKKILRNTAIKAKKKKKEVLIGKRRKWGIDDYKEKMPLHVAEHISQLFLSLQQQFNTGVRTINQD